MKKLSLVDKLEKTVSLPHFKHIFNVKHHKIVLFGYLISLFEMESIYCVVLEDGLVSCFQALSEGEVHHVLRVHDQTVKNQESGQDLALILDEFSVI